MLIVLEPAYVNEWGGGRGAINMVIVAEPIFSYYSFMGQKGNWSKRTENPYT